MKNDLTKSVNTLVPKDYLGFVHCHLKRVKEGLPKGLSTLFSLYFDGENDTDQVTFSLKKEDVWFFFSLKIFLLSARKHLTISGHSEYFIGTDAENPSNLTNENSIAKLSGMNLTDTEYILYDQQTSSNNPKQSAAIIYVS